MFNKQISNTLFKGLQMRPNVLIIVFFITFIMAIGCDNSYFDEHLQMEVQQLDRDLDNRWSTSGVVINSISKNGPAEKADLVPGELISYVIGEYAIKSTGDFTHAVKKAIANDNNLLLYLEEKQPIRIAIRQMGDKVGLEVEGKDSIRIKAVTPGSPAANSDAIQIGDVVQKIVDERKIHSLRDYKKSVAEFAERNSSIKFRTSELIGVKIAAVTALGNLGDARAVNELIDILKNNPELSLRKSAVRSLERLVVLSELDLLFSQFRQQNVSQLPADILDNRQRESAEILGLLLVDPIANTATLEAPFGIQFRDRSEELYERVNEGQLVKLAAEHIQLSIEPEQEIRRACLSILGILKPISSIQPLIHVLRDQSEIPGIRFQAGLALSRIGESSVDSLIAAFNETDSAAKDIVVSALGTIGGPIARDFLINTLDTTNDPAIQLTLVDAIAKIGDQPSLTALERQRVSFQEDDSAIQIFLDEVFSGLTTTISD